MCVEIEAKLKVDSLSNVEGKLKELGAEFIAEQSQSDIQFDDVHSSLITTDRCLRLRRQSVGDDVRVFLTYKGAKEKSDFKKRQEIEIETDRADMTQRLLQALGYRQILVVEKKRQLWRLGKCEVALDQLPQLGYFVEIEGPDSEAIAKVQTQLGLVHLPSITKSYPQMIQESLNKDE